uniref:Plectin/eS10 N-terminal domain-containing protein n=1 Tax=Strombidium rassoulzadegani TaxID=1082188 RepID=A0A7S3CJS9_9SPIT|mmetsp:Transcript_13113/g.22140  ORF Transcript_13113/g.22140 Transcript_13113/m.22140 type:complete len:127 (+) Transcript_13113:30-410(+)|eukprot:CAMPEP_0168607604 /NCGR_PEP_ID=MMETSP0449_2-20121227/145_1 /TAXON_ID=1082188 /ORGANISM="Strombidium rassoulzadegani, Strain ras09" /LENGTH=126 /DNA_ID=CAMNT_0008647459 /DNA_START=320 /DNA_END=700 /DNA_ORIENTATION=+
MVLVSRENRRALFEYILREGVIVVKKDAYLPKHQQVEVPNLHAMMLVKSLKSRGCLHEVFSWGWGYYFLTNSGIEYLIQELGLPADSKILPATHQKKRVKTVTTTADGKEEKEEGEDEDEKPAKEE